MMKFFEARKGYLTKLLKMRFFLLGSSVDARQGLVIEQVIVAAILKINSTKL